jgi:hypothetical protein
MASRDLVLMAQQCPRPTAVGKPHALWIRVGIGRKTTSEVVTNAGIATVEQYDLRMPDPRAPSFQPQRVAIGHQAVIVLAHCRAL